MICVYIQFRPQKRESVGCDFERQPALDTDP